jgi:hypothetical protein
MLDDIELADQGIVSGLVPLYCWWLTSTPTMIKSRVGLSHQLSGDDLTAIQG